MSHRELTQTGYFDARGSRIILERGAACQGCAQQSGCGTALLAQRHVADLPGAHLPACQQDGEVRLQLPARAFVLTCAAVYPGLAMLMVFGAWLGGLFWQATPDIGAVGGAAGGLMVGGLLLKLYDSQPGGFHLLDRLTVERSADL